MAADISEVGPVGDRNRLKEEIRQIKKSLGSGVGTRNAPFESQRRLDRGMLMRRLKEKEDNLTRISPPKLSVTEKNHLNEEKKRLEKEIGENMQSRDTMMGKGTQAGGRIAYPGAIDREVQFQKKYGAKATRLKQICRVLDPDNPALANLERLRAEHHAFEKR